MLYLGDCLDKLKELADNSVDSVVTDAPYGLSFMGKKWDYDVPSVAIWTEVLRVLKPGGHLLSFGGTRTYHRMVVNIEDAGFEIRDQIQWIYGSGFPKSHNIGDGRGTALKPANEPIVLARKPLSESTVAKNVLKWGTGALNIDESRIGGNPGYKYPNGPGGNSFSVGEGKDGTRTSPVESTQGRWPANILFDETAAQMLDEQSGERAAGNFPKVQNTKSWKMSSNGKNLSEPRATDSGGASRFFYVAKASKRERNAGCEDMPLKTSGGMSGTLDGTLKTGSANERNNLNQNSHPTVKPIKLMEYLIKLITPPNGIVLDPFMGSGSTGVAAKKLGFEFIGIEREKEYVEIADKRISAAV